MLVRTTGLADFESDVRSGKFQQFLAIATAFFALVAGGEAFFEHLRGSFCQWVMWTPVWLSPIVAAKSVGTALDRNVARTVLPLTSAAAIVDGLLGFYHHLNTVQEMPGGIRGNFWYNFTAGPPLFAPLLFCAVSLMGLIASAARREGS